jgi:hypothetical protein
MNPQTVIAVMTASQTEMLSVLWLYMYIRMDSDMIAAQKDADAVTCEQAARRSAAYRNDAVPNTNGSAIPAISLSTLISLRIFAKVANILLTLH